ncbi:Uncharacterized conserved protein YtfP, gamma-glutamylcyclotransferase (GGCT)/AIG2-like family [Fontimonas thermophila]|uniref:Putative gamma-glutamylcyclotransferase n=1 Tax=Fontimonas thermophila TaxID=1076937 RepID=A0A1I2J998_9GAMM|nr:gamma-glutamylcyclotransferase family protein [Fontimonas thermophila]SFF50638.1 Uncharacterized conserved protein YtfP, gamma-glutamylcyclotransferase (GGCT)/AIG2-like family [Fontimonas thermophila]
MRRIRLFVYGSLLVGPVACAVLGRTPAYRPAVLDGYRRCSLRGQRFPGLLPDPAAQTPGALIEVSPRELRRLDRYEDDFYLRRCVQVRCAQGHLPAQTYVLDPRCRRYALARPWQIPRHATSARGLPDTSPRP